ncbi:MAG: c-type cytochrome [Gemmataceae bacterium]
MRLKCLTAGIVVFVMAGLGQVRADEKPGKQKAKGQRPTDLVQQGDYLANQVAHCNHCHTPHDARGKHDDFRLLEGATLPFAPIDKSMKWAKKAPDITSSGLAGKWSEDEMVKFLTSGVNPEGDKPMPPMPVFRLNANDARAITLYLKSLPSTKENTKEKEKGPAEKGR